MRIYLIKRKGSTYWWNMVLDRSITFADETKVFCDFIFYRKKDAQKYLKTFEHKEYFEVVGATIDKSKTNFKPF